MPPSYHQQMGDASERIINEALAAEQNCVAAAARRLGLERTYLYQLIRNLGLGLPPCQRHARQRAAAARARRRS